MDDNDIVKIIILRLSKSDDKGLIFDVAGANILRRKIKPGSPQKMSILPSPGGRGWYNNFLPLLLPHLPGEAGGGKGRRKST
ncbi:MAG: hypothetical protein C0394_11425 [Syntrophus sp. (in: bacteria)]|nr:hypothetical protein [Syntrophus sp. (in: bacteria)]